MRRFRAGAALAAALIWATPAESAPLGIAGLGVGGYGITTFPIGQDDAGTGLLYGLRVRLDLLPILQVEPSVSVLDSGDGRIDLDDRTLELSGPNMMVFALNAVLRTGGGLPFSPYVTAGIGRCRLDALGGSETEYLASTNVGLGAELAFGSLSADVSPRLFVIKTESGASRKNLGILAGINYYFR